MSSLTAKPLHGHFYSLLNDDLIDRHRSLCRLRYQLHSETSPLCLLFICTRVMEAKIIHKTVPSVLYRVCGQSVETIVHLLVACCCPLLAIATSAYLYYHNLNLVASAFLESIFHN